MASIGGCAGSPAGFNPDIMLEQVLETAAYAWSSIWHQPNWLPVYRKLRP